MSNVVDGAGVTDAGRPRFWLLALAVVSSLVLGAVIGVLLLAPERDPGDTSAEAGFARDMSVHHAQAVDIAFIAYDATDDRAIRRLAFDIINTQRTQIGMFSGWLQEWGLPQTSVRPPMMWSDHAHSEPVENYADMPGMASATDLEYFRTLHGEAAEMQFIRLMIDHHRGGVEMAEAVLPLTDRTEVQRLAQTIIDGQEAEVVVMQEMLEERESSAIE